jgi:hypothetical protein
MPQPNSRDLGLNHVGVLKGSQLTLVPREDENREEGGVSPSFLQLDVMLLDGPVMYLFEP